ncbi:MAG: hypothetical protein OXJ52_10190 [Oligoflexia bacterium]|nr:hypothetical protein [Oligoflexia bacterium]
MFKVKFLNLNKILKSEQGFSLVGVLVASTIGFVVLMGIVESMGNISKSVRKGNQSFSVLDMKKDIMRISQQNASTGEVSSCTNTLKGIKTSGHNTDQDTNIHSYTFPEERSLKMTSVAPGTNSQYKVYKDDTNESDVYFGSLVVHQMRFEKDLPSGPVPTANITPTTGKFYITFGDKAKSYIHFEDLTPLLVEDILYNPIDSETIESCNFKLDIRTIVNCYTVTAVGQTLVGCGDTQNIPINKTTAFGYNISTGSTSLGAYNSFFGFEAAKNNTSGAKHSFFGYSAGHANTTGSNNSFFGYLAGHANTTGSNNSFFGYEVGKMIAKGSDNSFFGYHAGYGHQTATPPAISTGSKNTFIGNFAGYENITGSQNVIIGYEAGYKHPGRNNATLIGSYAGRNNFANTNTFIGASSGMNSTGWSNTFIGFKAGFENKGQTGNTIIGHQAGYDGTGQENSIVGHEAGHKNEGELNVLFGALAGYRNKGDKNVFIGRQAGFWNNTGFSNVFIGQKAGFRHQTGELNVFIGDSTGYKTKSKHNTFVGSLAGFNTELGQSNTYVGVGAGKKNINGSYNTFIGDSAGTKSGGKNTIVGMLAGNYLTMSGNENVFLGMRAGGLMRSGHGNILIGHEAGFGAFPSGCGTPCPQMGSGNNNIYIGQKVTTPNHDNEIHIGNDSHEVVYIAGAGGSTPSLRDLRIGNLINIQDHPTDISRRAINIGSTGNFEHVRIGPPGLDSIKLGKYDLKNDIYTPLHNFISSRFLKKNIKPFDDYDQALQDIMETKLSNYQYKDNHPNHTRRGFIAENLPQHLQLPQEKGSHLVKPDWASIWGTFWAGIKALAIKFDSLKKEMSEKIAEFAKSLEVLKQSLTVLKHSFSALQKEVLEIKSSYATKEELSALKAENAELKRELANTKKEIADIKKSLKK